MAALSNYIENKVVDWFLRAQAYAPVATVYVALYTATPTAAGGGTEVSGGSYARVAITAALANWAGTQAAASTVASTGTSGLTSNNGVLTYPAPTASWGVVTSFGVFDAATGGNLLFFGALTTSKTINNGDGAPSFAAAALSLALS